MSIKRTGSLVGKNKNETRNKAEIANDFSENFDPPDGGWGWIIVVAAGFSNFCILPVLQSFGLLFRDKFAELGINSSQTTTILNMNTAVTSCIGLANGPLFRKFSYRQIAFVGALVCAASITILSTVKTFTGILIFFSILLGAGVGITMSANALALNTYFKKKRRIATGLSWTCTGMGPIVMPQIITLLMPLYGMEGTVLVFGGFAFNAVVCALLLQPVSRHIKRKQSTEKLSPNENLESRESSLSDKVLQEVAKQCDKETFYRSLENIDDNRRNSYGTLNLARGKFGSQYLYYDDEEGGASGIDVLGPGTPMMSRANDGWFSRKNTSTTSITSKSSRRESTSRNTSRRPSINLSRQSSLNKGSSTSISVSLNGDRIRELRNYRQNNETEKSRRKISVYQPSVAPLIIVAESCEHAEEFEHCKESNCNHKSEEKSITIPEVIETDQLLHNECVEEPTRKTFLEALIIFFDLDLLRDLVFVNMMMGITFANFAEMNFSLLTPFILSDYGFTKIQVATVMSILGGIDVFTRLIIPFIADFIGWQNRTFFLVGICTLAAGRIVLAHVQDFTVVLAVTVLIGVGKALRTIFMALVIPGHVPLSRLPGATGIQLLTSGVLALALGPIVGWIRDMTSNYSLMLHCLNIFTYLTTISWWLEMYFAKEKSMKAAREIVELNKLNA